MVSKDSRQSPCLIYNSSQKKSVPLKTLSGQVQVGQFFKIFIFICCFHISCAYKMQQNNSQNSTFLSDKGLKDTVVNQALPSLHEGPLEITLTVP